MMMSKRTKPQKNSKSSIPERRLILPIELRKRRERASLSEPWPPAPSEYQDGDPFIPEKERPWSTPSRHGNDDALYNRADYHPYDYSDKKYGGRGDSMG